jgi:hypothetical protein
MARVEEFMPRLDGGPGPLQSTGRVRVGDYLVGINRRSVLAARFDDVVQMLMAMPPGCHVLTVCRARRLPRGWAGMRMIDKVGG